MAIEKQIWIDKLMDKMYPENSFISECVDMSELVEYNKINLAEAGVDPTILVDNAVFPVPTVQRVDTAIEIPLHTLDTVNTVVRNVEEMELAYNKMESVVRGHRKALQKEDGKLALFNWAPTADGAFTPVAASTGTANPAGLKSLTFEDVLNHERLYRDMDVDMDDLRLVLTSQHLSDLMAEDLKLYKEVMASGKLFSFKIFAHSQTPLFTSAGTKDTYGSVPGAGDYKASISWVKSEMMKCEGDYDVFAKYKDPGERGDVIGFQQRFHALPFRSKYSGALYSVQ